MTGLAAKSLIYQSQADKDSSLQSLLAVSALLLYSNTISGSALMAPALAALETDVTAPVDFKEIGSVTAVITLSDVQQLSRAYIFYDYQKVESYISLHPDIVGTLLNAIPQIKRFFGNNTNVSLRVSCDQESEPSLSAYIQTAMSVDDARTARKSFNTSWWMSQPDTSGVLLTFNLEYV